jgi:hypothetical protein
LHAIRISGNTVMKFNKNGNSVRHGTLAIPGHKFSIRKMVSYMAKWQLVFAKSRK